MPGRGIGYGLLRYLAERSAAELAAAPAAEVAFNYLGQFDRAVSEGAFFALRGRSRPEPRSSGRSPRRHLLEVAARCRRGRLEVGFGYSEGVHRRETVERLAEGYARGAAGADRALRGRGGGRATRRRTSRWPDWTRRRWTRCWGGAGGGGRLPADAPAGRDALPRALRPGAGRLRGAVRLPAGGAAGRGGAGAGVAGRGGAARGAAGGLRLGGTAAAGAGRPARGEAAASAGRTGGGWTRRSGRRAWRRTWRRTGRRASSWRGRR